MSDDNSKNDTVGLFLRAMVDREPGKRKVKPSKSALIDLAELDLGESSDDSDFKIDEEKLKEEDDISINSDPDDCDDDDDDDLEDENGTESSTSNQKENGKLTVEELLKQAQQRQSEALEKGITRPKILVCAICLGDYSDDLNEVVTCDGCHISVHEGCYGISDTISISSTVSSSSTEPWFCDACKAGVSDPPCELCPNLGYTIFKETEIGRWVHLVCALYVPGIAFSEVDKLSFPTLFEMPYSRYGAKVCSLCEDERYCKTGVCIGCDAGMCRSYFHVTCAQREGLLSEVNHGEADQADPYYAHCKLHTDRELIRRRKRNWLALQLHMKEGQKEKLEESKETHERLHSKLLKYREKYQFTKANRPTPWFPTQKMPRSLSTSASFFRTLLHKTKLMGVETETHVVDQSIGEIRKKWHIPPAFNVEFISYYLDRTTRLQEMKAKLDSLLKENESLTKEENELKKKLDKLEIENKEKQTNNANMLNKALEIHDHLKGLAGRPLRLPPSIAALHNPPFVGLERLPQVGAVGKEKRLITKAATKMISYSLPSSPAECESGPIKQPQQIKSPRSSAAKNKANDPNVTHECGFCHLTKHQHLLIQCDSCINYYHLACLDPPLLRMPKKTKQMGWQCSDCCKSSDSDKTSEIDMLAPRRLRRDVQQDRSFEESPTKTPTSESKTKTETTNSSWRVSKSLSPQRPAKKATSAKSPKNPTKRRSSSDLNRGIRKKRKSADYTSKKGKKRNLGNEADVVAKTKMKKGNKCNQVKNDNADSSNAGKKSVTSQGHDTNRGCRPKIKSAPTDNVSLRPKRFTEDKVSEDSTLNVTSKDSKVDPSSSVSETEVSNTHNNVSTSICNGNSSSTTNTKTMDTISKVSCSVENVASTSCANTVVSTSVQNNVVASSVENKVVATSESKPDNKVTDEISSTKNNTIPVLAPSTTANSNCHGSVASSNISCGQSYITSGPSNIPLDVSAESLPSTSSMNSPYSESFPSADDDPNSPKKEKRHRDGSKKKKKDKDKQLDGMRKKKKHHHRDKHNLGEMASELVSPFRIKIKPLPPRPNEIDSLAVPISNQGQSNGEVNAPHTTSTTTAPPGYPPLPPGYTLTQPVMVSLTPISTVGINNGSSATASATFNKNSNTYTSTATSAPIVTSQAGRQRSNMGRRKSDSGAEQFSICDVCKETGGVTNTVMCDECLKAYHFNCLEPPLKKSPKRRGYSWFCEDCDSAATGKGPKETK